MPAIQLARLKQQVSQLAEHFHNPATFVRQARDLFEFYASRAHRASQVGEPAPLIPAYRVPEQVLRHILLPLGDHIQAHPQSALVLADALWAQPQLEFRLLACNILGSIAPIDATSITDHLLTWNRENQEEALLDALASDGLRRMRTDAPEQFFPLVEGWLSSSKLRDQKLGLRALRALVVDAKFANLPVVYRLLGQSTHDVHTDLRRYLLDLLLPLAKRSPQETAYFLRQTLAKSPQSNTKWLVRRCLDSFPADIQHDLRAILKR